MKILSRLFKSKLSFSVLNKVERYICVNMASEVDKSQHILPLDQPVVFLEAATAFSGLSLKEKLYAHHLSQASWAGGLITLIQTSPESGPTFVLLHKLFLAQNPQEFKANALKQGFTEDEVTALFVYTAGLFSNSGNYKGFGDTKFIPGIEPDRLEALLKTSPVWSSELQPLWEKLKNPIYNLDCGRKCLGFPPQGCTTYLSKNCDVKDQEEVQKWLKSQNMEFYNTRLFKKSNGEKTEYEIRLASEDKGEVKKIDENNVSYLVTKGDYSPLIGKVAKHLEEAIPYAANETEVKMLRSYVSSFKTGSLNDHKEGSRYWIQDKGPVIETYIGFIETYRDPAGVRGEFEGFVAAVNKEMSAKFANLVERAEDFLPLLPWPKGYEKDTFLRPDFTSLDVLTFAGSGIPAGINIPNYDEIRQSEGFKNVSLGNVIPASYQQTVNPFLSPEDDKLLQKYRVPSFELQVGLHELLGHGSGKLLRRENDGTLNYPPTLVDPLTGKPPSSCYEAGDTYDSKFGQIGSAYEECRAEAVGLYLCLEPKVLEIFGHKGEEANNIVYVNWLSLIYAGAGKALEMWEPGRGWLQAHSQARYVLTQVLIEAGAVSVTQPNEGDLLISLNRDSIRGAGRTAIENFLLQLQVHKANGNSIAAQKLFNRYSEVKEPWLSWRNIIIAKKQPRKMFVQPNTVSTSNDVNLKAYEPNCAGLIQSWVERFSDPESVHKAILELSEADAQYF